MQLYHLQFDDPGMTLKTVSDQTEEQVRALVAAEKSYSVIFIHEVQGGPVRQIFLRNQETNYCWKALQTKGPMSDIGREYQ